MQTDCAIAPPIEIIATRKGEIEIDGYLAIWGSADQRDCYNTWFDRKCPPEMGLDLLPIALFYEHNEQGSVRKSRIGQVISAVFDDIGIHFRAIIDLARPFAHRALKEIKAHELATSSGSSSHLAKFDDDGRFVDWMLAELSLTKYPCEHRMPKVELVRRADGLFTLPASHPQTSCTRCGETKGQSSSNTSPAIDVPQCACQGTSNLSETKRDIRMPMSLEELGFSPDVATTEIAQALIDNFGRDMVSMVFNAVFDVEGTDLSDFDALLATAMNEFPDSNQEELALLVQVLYAVITERDDGQTVIENALGQAEEEAEEEPEPEPTLSNPELERPQASVDTPLELDAPEPTESARSQQDIDALHRTISELNERITDMATRTDVLTPPLNQVPEEVRSMNIQVTDRRYDRFNAFQLAYGYELLRAATIRHIEGAALPSERYMNALGAKLERLISQDPMVRSRFAETGLNLTRADELISVTNASTYVGSFFSDELWTKIRTRRVYQALLAAGLREVEVPQGASDFKILAEGADPTVYHAAESQDTTSSVGYPVATAGISAPSLSLKTVSMSKLSIRVMPTGEMVEDAIIDFLPFLSQNMEESMAAAIEHVMIMGDTETGGTGNINSDDGAPTAGTKWLALNGFKKLALVTNTANARDGSTLAADDYNSTRKLLGVNGLDPKSLVHLVDTDTYFTTVPLDEVETVDKFGQPDATILTGDVEMIYGSPLMPSDQIGLTEADGKIGVVTPANNTKGSITTVAAPRWTVGWKRKVVPEVMRWPGADATEIVMHVRWGMASADNDAAAVSYNITV